MTHISDNITTLNKYLDELPSFNQKREFEAYFIGAIRAEKD